MTRLPDMTSAARAVLAALALTSFGGCAHQQTPRATPTPATAPAAPASERPPSPAAAPPPPSASPAQGTAAAPTSPSPTRAAAGSTPRASPPKRPAPAAPSGSASAPAPAPAPAASSPPLNLASLEQRLRDTHAIGVFTKLSLKNQVDDLLTQFRDFYAGKGTLTLAELRRSYELLLMKVVTLLQDADPGLASAVATSREAIWAILSNRTSFNNL